MLMFAALVCIACCQVAFGSSDIPSVKITKTSVAVDLWPMVNIRSRTRLHIINHTILLFSSILMATVSRNSQIQFVSICVYLCILELLDSWFVSQNEEDQFVCQLLSFCVQCLRLTERSINDSEFIYLFKIRRFKYIYLAQDKQNVISVIYSHWANETRLVHSCNFTSLRQICHAVTAGLANRGLKNTIFLVF